MKTANLTVKLDETTKQEFKAFCENVGLNPSIAINMFIRYVVNNQKLPFSVSIPNKETIDALEEVRLLKQNPNKKIYNSFSEILSELENEEI